MQRQLIRAAFIGFLGANVATLLAGLLYGLTALHEDLTAESLVFFGYVTLSSELTLVPAGAVAGVLSWAVLRRLGTVGGILVAMVLVTSLGALVGYSFTWSAPHVLPWHAVVDVAAAWGITSLVVLSVVAWKGAARR